MTKTAPRLTDSLTALSPLISAIVLISAITLTVAAMLTGVAVAQGGAPTGNAQRGKRLYLAVGCYECHGTTGTGAITGPRIAPNPVPFPAFIYQLRHPLGSPPYGNIKMPAYGAAVLSDTQVADIYAYLASIGPSPPASKIPLLNR
jgi:mono/diheme cytochrome c family protein